MDLNPDLTRVAFDYLAERVAMKAGRADMAANRVNGVYLVTILVTL
jgi:hypothetical protein